MTAYQRFCHDVVLPLSDIVLGQQVRSRLTELLRFQWYSREAINRHRDQRVSELLCFCQRQVPFYRDAFEHVGVSEADLSKPGVLETLPILTKTHLRESFDALQVTGFSETTYKMMSSGSTGVQTVVLLDKTCQDEVFATQLMFWAWGGFAMGAPHLQTGMSLNRGLVRTIKDLVFRCDYTSAFGLTDPKISQMVETIRSRRAQHVLGYASSIYVIARYIRDQGLTLPLKAAFTWGDSLFPHYRDLIESAFECPVFDVYGLGEGLQCAAQCGRGDSLHVAEHGVVVEVVDADGKACAAGELGRVVVTRLEAGVMPLVRYDTGDVAYWVEDECRCARHLKQISRIQGRSTDIVTTPAGDRLIVHYFTQIFEMIPEIEQFQVRQSEPASIQILYIQAPGFSQAILDRVRNEIAENCEYPLGIEFREVDEIPLEKSNKRRFVVSEIPF